MFVDHNNSATFIQFCTLMYDYKNMINRTQFSVNPVLLHAVSCAKFLLTGLTCSSLMRSKQGTVRSMV